MQDEAARRKQVRNTLIAAFSNLSTAYNLVNINLAHVLMENQYCGGDHCKEAVTTASTACLAGAILGQLTFGYVGDCLGRGRALFLTMILSILGALASAFAVPVTSDPSSVFTFISITRLILGVGVGGVYPLAATIAAESSSDASRGRQVSLVFSMQGVGTLMVPLVGMVFIYGFGTYEDRHHSNLALPGISWRLILGIGALPGIILMPFKTASTSQSQNASQPSSSNMPVPQAESVSVFKALCMRKYWRSIIGCAGGWFLFDVTFYGNTLFAPTILKSVFHEKVGKGPAPVIGGNIADNLCLQLLVLALLGLPGYYISVWLMDRVGRKIIQLQGFIFMALLYAALGFSLKPMKHQAALLLIVYGLTYFFSNFGPNSTTFILPSESFPFEVRSSLNGFSAAMGKLGATLGSACFKPIVNSAGTGAVFYLCAGCAGLGVVLTALCIDDRRGRGMKGQSFVITEEGSCCGPGV